MKAAVTIVLIIISFVFEHPTYAHDGHEDPVLQELNDYIMAIQLMRINDPSADELFKTWQELRTESWAIRKLTDEQNLLINTEEVMKQIAKTRAKRKQLLDDLP